MSEVRLLTTTEVAKHFKVTAYTVRRWIASGWITPTITTPGGQYRFSEEAVEAFGHFQQREEMNCGS